MKDILQDLADTPGVTGDEGRVREKIKDYLVDHVDDPNDLYEDDFGNLIARKGNGEKTLMIAAHMDQIGFRVKSIDDDGYLRVSNVGGINPQLMEGQRLHFYDDHVWGEILAVPPHLADGDSTDMDVPEYIVDIGATSADDARNHVNIGSYAVYDPGFTDLVNNRVSGSALDNRIGCAVAIEAFRQYGVDYDPSYELAVVFTREEEVGLKGAKTSATHLDPDIGLAIDTSVAGDEPYIDSYTESTVNLGDGPVITLQESGGRGLIADKNVVDWMEYSAASQGRDYQLEVGDGGSTDAATIYTVLEGIPSGSLGVPTRNLHSPGEIASMEDIYETVTLMDDMLYTFDEFF